jgi:hypothetical protein
MRPLRQTTLSQSERRRRRRRERLPESDEHEWDP